MRFLPQNGLRTVGGTVLSGAVLGFTLALAYSLAFAIYAIVRSSVQIVAILPPAAGLFSTIVVNAFAIVMPSLVIGLLLGIGAAILLAITLLLVYGLSAWLNPQRLPMRALWIGWVTAGMSAAVIQMTMQRGLGPYFDALWPSGYFFWLGLPCLLFVGAIGWISWRQATTLGLSNQMVRQLGH